MAGEISGVVQHPAIPLRCWSPINESHQRSRMGLESCAVLIDAVEHDGRDRENHTWWRKFSFGESVVNKDSTWPRPCKNKFTLAKRLSRPRLWFGEGVRCLI